MYTLKPAKVSMAWIISSYRVIQTIPLFFESVSPGKEYFLIQVNKPLGHPENPVCSPLCAGVSGNRLESGWQLPWYQRP
jgi:hypothetical protein